MGYKNPEDAKAYRERYYATHREKILLQQQEYYKENKEMIIARVKLYEINNKEKIQKKKHEKYLLKKKDVQIYNKQYYIDNKERIIQKTHQYYIENKISILIRAQNYHNSIPEKVKIWKGNYREKNREVLRIKGRIYSKNHKTENIIRSARRRAWKNGASLNDFTPAQWIEIQKAQKYCCYYCGKRRKGRLTQDHIVPLSKGGSHTLHNVIAACRFCNQSKGNRKPPIPVQPFLLTIAPSKKAKTLSASF